MGLTEGEALSAARRHFVPEYAVDVHHCDCGGTGCGAPAVELPWPNRPKRAESLTGPRT